VADLDRAGVWGPLGYARRLVNMRDTLYILTTNTCMYEHCYGTDDETTIASCCMLMIW